MGYLGTEPVSAMCKANNSSAVCPPFISSLPLPFLFTSPPPSKIFA